MKFLTRSLVAALAVAFGFSGVSFAYEGAVLSADSYLGGGCGCATACSPCGDACGDCGCYSDCCGCCDDGGLLGGWGLFGEAELLFLRYHRADGIRVGDSAASIDEDGELDFEPAYRLSAGVVAPNGIGFRTRYFEFNHTGALGDPDLGGTLGVDTYVIDFELFEAFALNQNWAMEISGGVRYVNFQETMLDAEVVGPPVLGDLRTNGVNAGGLVTGIEARRAVGGLGLLYARTRLAVVQGDKDVFQGTDVGGAPVAVQGPVGLIDWTGGMVELAVGGEVNYALANGAVLFARSGLEFQNWWNFSSEFDFLTGEDTFDGASDVGFGGFAFSVGMSY
jgi:hypothetical protein